MTAAALKKVVKQAIDESFRAHRAELEEKIIERLEDMALIRAMDAARHSKPVSREQVMRTLRGKTK